MRVPPQGLSLRWFVRFLESETFREALLLSLQVALTTTCIVVTLATMAALCHRALSRRLGAAFRVAMTLPLLERAGIRVSDSPSELGTTLLALLNG